MSSFYGNIKNNSRASFIFDRIYPSRCAMEDALSAIRDANGEVQGDGVFINRYVLVNYCYTADGKYIEIDRDNVQPINAAMDSKYIVTEDNYTSFYVYNASDRVYSLATKYFTSDELDNGYKYYKKSNFYDRYETVTSQQGEISRVENQYFAQRRNDDRNRYHADYHLTVWMKIYTDNVEHYIQVGRLKAEAPALELIVDAPSDVDGPHFDLYNSSDINYMYHAPKNWVIALLDGEDADISNTLEDDAGNLSYPYFNISGFNELKNHRANRDPSGQNTNDGRTIENKIDTHDYPSGELYPIHTFIQIDITPDTYYNNWYYIYDTNSEKYVLDQSGRYSVNQTYYIKTTPLDQNGTLARERQNDERLIRIQLPAIGDAVSDLYDVLYGFKGYDTDRPYTRQQLFNYRNISPYNNINSTDDISMGWAMEEFKNYISELRFLGHGQGWRLLGYTKEETIPTYTSTDSPVMNESQVIMDEFYNLTTEELDALRPYNESTGYIIPVYVYGDTWGLGLQSDWTLDDKMGFGYLYHRPRILWANPEYSKEDPNSEQAKNDTGNAPETDYFSMHSIEYIYDHFEESENTELFGFNRVSQLNVTRNQGTATVTAPWYQNNI